MLLLDEPTSALNLPVAAHMCTRVSVMNAGLVLEELSSEELHQRRANSPYTRRLLAASEGYHPALLGDPADLAIEPGLAIEAGS